MKPRTTVGPAVRVALVKKTDRVLNTPEMPPEAPPLAPADREPAGEVARPTALRIRIVCCLIGGTGLFLVVAGSFLPWVISGSVQRSSYAMVGVLKRLGVGGDGPIGILVSSWPLTGMLCMTPVVAAALQWWRLSGGLAVLLSLAAALLSFGVIAVTNGRSAAGIGVDPIGPSVMAAGAVLMFTGGIALAIGAGSPVRRRTGQLSANKQQ